MLDAEKGTYYMKLEKILPKLKVVGFDISKYGIKFYPEIKKYLFNHDVRKKQNLKKEFDLVISLGCLHNLMIFDLVNAIKEINRIGKSGYIMVESYRDEKELLT